MAQLAENGRWVKLEVGVWYEEKTDRIHINTRDKDAGSGLFLTPRKGTKGDRNMRALLRAKGVADADRIPPE